MLQIEENVSLARYTTFGIGGPARYFAKARQKLDFLEICQFALKKNIPLFVLGKGSNCLFDDRGYHGLVVLNKCDTILHRGSGIYIAESGASFSLLGTETARNGYSGLEFASGIPGTVGGAVYMNAGANQRETKDALQEISFLTLSGEEKIFKKEKLTFHYRTSPFQNMKGVILNATFALEENKNARQEQIEIIQYRTKTQPYGEKSAGCIFKNLTNQPAGALIESLGLKGLSLGGAEISKKHANFLINSNNGKASDILALIALIQKKVKEKTGLELETEIKYIPYEGFQS